MTSRSVDLVSRISRWGCNKDLRDGSYPRKWPSGPILLGRLRLRQDSWGATTCRVCRGV